MSDSGGIATKVGSGAAPEGRRPSEKELHRLLLSCGFRNVLWPSPDKASLRIFDTAHMHPVIPPGTEASSTAVAQCMATPRRHRPSPLSL